MLFLPEHFLFFILELFKRLINTKNKFFSLELSFKTRSRIEFRGPYTEPRYYLDKTLTSENFGQMFVWLEDQFKL